MALVMTKAALALKNAGANLQVVKFESYKPKKRKIETNEIEDVNVGQNSKKNLDLKKVRHEVVKFGMSGFDAAKKQEAKIALAVSLGAKPPKKEYINYKELMQKRKEEKQKDIELRQMMISKTNLKTSGKKKKQKIFSNDVGHLLSSYGKVKKKDVQKEAKGIQKNVKRKSKPGNLKHL